MENVFNAQNIEFLMQGLFLTLKIALATCIISIVFGTFLAITKNYGDRLSKFLAACYIDIFRNTPLLLWMLAACFVLPVFFGQFPQAFWGTIGFSLYTSSVMAEIIRGGLNSIPKGQFEAAYSQGFGKFFTLFKSEKVKKILLRVIALVILFLAIMIVMKLINGSGDENTQNQSVLPSEPIATQDNNNDTSFESMPITDNTSAEDQFEALRKQFQDEQNTTQNTTTSSSNNNDTTNFAMPDQEVPAEPTATTSANTTPQASTPKQEVTQTAKSKEEAKNKQL